MTVVINGDTGIDTVQDNAITTADLQNGAVTGAKLSGAQTGTAPIYGCRAWCVFNGATTGTNAPLAGGNVTSVTRTGTGTYNINLATALPDTNFALAVTCANTVGNTTVIYEVVGTRNSSLVQVYAFAGGAFDPIWVSIAIFR